MTLMSTLANLAYNAILIWIFSLFVCHQHVIVSRHNFFLASFESHIRILALYLYVPYVNDYNLLYESPSLALLWPIFFVIPHLKHNSKAIMCRSVGRSIDSLLLHVAVFFVSYICSVWIEKKYSYISYNDTKKYIKKINLTDYSSMRYA